MKDRWPHGPAIFGSQSRWPLDPASTVLNWEAASGRLFFSATGILDVACWHIASVIAAQRNVRSWMQAGSDRHVAKEFVVPAKAGTQTTRRCQAHDRRRLCRDRGSRLSPGRQRSCGAIHIWPHEIYSSFRIPGRRQRVRASAAGWRRTTQLHIGESRAETSGFRVRADARPGMTSLNTYPAAAKLSARAIAQASR
jgi:hypothetical protein